MAKARAVKKANQRKSKSRKTPSGSRPDKSGFSIPPALFANVSPHSIGGMSMFDYAGPFDADIVSNFMSDEDLIWRAAQALQDAGFDVLQMSPYTINVAAPIATYERAFKTQIVARELDTLKSGGRRETATYFTAADTDRFGLIQTRRSLRAIPGAFAMAERIDLPEMRKYRRALSFCQTHIGGVAVSGLPYQRVADRCHCHAVQSHAIVRVVLGRIPCDDADTRAICPAVSAATGAVSLRNGISNIAQAT